MENDDWKARKPLVSADWVSRKSAQEGDADATTGKQPSPALGAEPVALSEAQERARKREELQGWASSAWIAGEDEVDPVDRRPELYSFLCGLLGWFIVGEEMAAKAASTAPSAGVQGWRKQPWMSVSDWNGGRWMTHEEALGTIRDAASVSTLSYEEAVLVYARGRGFIVDDARMMASPLWQ